MLPMLVRNSRLKNSQYSLSRGRDFLDLKLHQNEKRPLEEDSRGRFFMFVMMSQAKVLL